MEPDKQLEKAKNNAYSLLRSRPRSEAELRLRLGMKGHGNKIIETVISTLKQSQQIDDVKFARFWIESRMHANPAGDTVLRYELKAKGVADSVIDAALAEKAENYDEYKVASAMAAERFAQFVKLDKRKALKRVYDFLGRRGFSYDVIQRVLDDVIGHANRDID